MTDFASAIAPIREQLKKSLEVAWRECEEYAASHFLYDKLKPDDGVSCLCIWGEFPSKAARAIDQLLSVLGHPLACTREEVTRAFQDHYHLAVSSQEYDQAFERAISLLGQMSRTQHYSSPFVIGSGPLFIGKLDDVEPIWEFKTPAAFVRIEISGYSHHNEGLKPFEEVDYEVENPRAEGIENERTVIVRSVRLEARILAYCSPGAMEALAKTIRQVAPSIFRSACSIEQRLHDSAFESSTLEHHQDGTTVTKEGPDPVVVCMSSGQLGSGFLWIREALGAFFLTRTLSKKDTFEKRIRNAVTLLAESDSQTSSAISLALCVTAIEAMIGQRGGGTDIGKTLSESIAVLLEPDRSQRLNAEGFFRKLYDLRSRVLHGDAIESEQEVVSSGRLLAAAVLKAFIERIMFTQRMSLTVDTPDQLLAQLRSLKYEQGQPTGIQESPVRCLWTKKNGE